MRVVRSTTGIDHGRADAFDAALADGTPCRETYSLDEIGQRDTQIRLIGYVDPDGQRRWAVAEHGPVEVHVVDFDDLDQALEEYDRQVRAATDVAGVEYDDDGYPIPLWAACDVPGIGDNEPDVAHAGDQQAREIAAGWLNDACREARHALNRLETLRRAAITAAVDAGATQTSLARQLGVQQATVADLVRRGREQPLPATAAITIVTVPDGDLPAFIGNLHLHRAVLWAVLDSRLPSIADEVVRWAGAHGYWDTHPDRSQLVVQVGDIPLPPDVPGSTAGRSWRITQGEALDLIQALTVG